MNKILSVLLVLCFFVNASVASASYAYDEAEKKSYKKLYYGIVLTLVGGFLAYDGFSTEEVDISKPCVDYATVLHSEWVQNGSSFNYAVRSGYTDNSTASEREDYTKYEIEKNPYIVEQNVLYNNGNVDLKNLAIEIRYKYDSKNIIGEHGEHLKDGGYHSASSTVDDKGKVIFINLKKGESIRWQDVWSYTTTQTSQPYGNEREPYTKDEEGKVINDGTKGLNLGKDALNLMDIRVKLNKNQQYKPIYEKRHKSEIEGVAGIVVGLAGIYFIVDHFMDMHKFNTYAKKHDLNFKIATASNEYKLMLQKRI